MIKVLTLKNEIEAGLLSSILEESNIPHMVRSYHDSAYKGLWQSQTLWGHIEALKQYEKQILSIYQSIIEN